MGLFIRWAIGAAALYLTVLIGKQFDIGLSFSETGAQSIGAAFVVVLVLTLVNALIRPIVKMLTLPLSCITFGLFGLVINAIMFYLVGELNVGLRVDGFVAALFGSVVTSILFGVLNMFVGEGKKRDE